MNSLLTSGGISILNSGVAVPKYASANIAAATTDGAVVAAVSGKKLRILDFKVSTVTGETTITFNSKPAGAGVAVSATFTAPIGVGSSGFCVAGHFETLSGEGLTVTTGAGNTIGVQVTYIEV